MFKKLFSTLCVASLVTLTGCWPFGKKEETKSVTEMTEVVAQTEQSAEQPAVAQTEQPAEQPADAKA